MHTHLPNPTQTPVPCESYRSSARAHTNKPPHSQPSFNPYPQASQTRQQSPPTPGYSFPPSLPHPPRPCRIYTDTPPRSPSRCPISPSTRPRPAWPSRPASCARDKARGVVVARERLRDSAGWWCGGSRSRGSSGDRRVQGGRRRRGSGWVRRPTGGYQVSIPVGLKRLQRAHSPSPSRTRPTDPSC